MGWFGHRMVQIGGRRMADNQPHLSIAEAGRLLRNGAISAPELTQDYLRRIAEVDPQIGAFSRVTADQALRQAQQAQTEFERGLDRGPLHGIPIALKDNIDTAAVATGANSHVLTGRIPVRDAAIVTRLGRAGAVPLGKTTLHEFAFGGPAWDLPDAPARNPWDRSRFTGGSSSGSAAALAADMAMAAVGTDTVGSIRLPAALSGIVGLKPSFGRLPTDGIVPLAYSLDHCGPMARTVADCRALWQGLSRTSALRNYAPSGSRQHVPDLAGLRVGYVSQFHTEDAETSPDVASAIENTKQLWRDMGATVSEIRLSSLSRYAACCMTIMLCEALAIHEDNLAAVPEKFGAILRDRLALATFFSAADYIQAQRLRQKLRHEMSQALTEVDVIVAGAFPTEAPPLGEVDKFYILQAPLMTTPFNVTGHPAICLPIALSRNRLPIGMQIAANLGQDDRLLDIAQCLEAAVGFEELRRHFAHSIGQITPQADPQKDPRR